MHGPWSQQSDELLRDAVKSIGIKWQPIRQHMKTKRALNAIIKRWHIKIKFQQQMRYYQQNPIKKTVSQYSLAKAKNKVQNITQQGEEKVVLWKKNWTDRNDKQLKMLVVQSGIMNWNILADTLQTDADQIKLRWKRIIYPTMIKQSSKVGGALKWSPLEDKILNIGFKQNISWEDAFRVFLPQRTLGSIQARWRRISKRFQLKQNIQNKYLARRQWLKRMFALSKQNQGQEEGQQDDQQLKN